MNKILTFFLLFFGLAVLFSCEKPEEEITPKITLETAVIPSESAVLSPDGGELSISFTSNVNWKAQSSAAWMTISPSSGEPGQCKVNIKTLANTTTSSRSATLTITAQDKSVTVKVEQVGLTPSELALSPELAKIGFNGGNVSIAVTSNTAWTASSNQTWCTISPDKGSGNGNFSITATKNETTSDRSAIVTVIAGSGTNTATKTVTVNQSAYSDKDALMALYNATDGPNWYTHTNWGTDANLSEWHGISVDSNGKVTEINLNDNNLFGSLPDEIGSLKSLTKLLIGNQSDYTGKKLTGSIPSTIANLTNLVELRLNNNQLTGDLSEAILSLTKLQYLYLGGNQFSGSIPAKLTDLSVLKELDLSSNKLTGSIPAEIGTMSTLRVLHLNSNQLSGLIPEEIKNITGLESFKCQDNNLKTIIPNSFLYHGHFGNWVFGPQNGNQDSGDRAALVALYFATNGPQWTAKDKWCTSADISEWSGVGTDAAGNVTWIICDGNNLNGTIPSELAFLTFLQELWLEENKLTGTIPPELGHLSKLSYLGLYDNQLTGSIPPELGNLTLLQYLHLHKNQLSGTVPPELGNLVNLLYLNINDNKLTGVLPTSIADIPNLAYFRCQNNYLTTPFADAFLNHSYYSNWTMMPQY